MVFARESRSVHPNLKANGILNQRDKAELLVKIRMLKRLK